LSVVVHLVIGAAYGKALLLLLWGTLIVGTADNVLRPLIIGNRTQIPTVFLFFGILGGLQAYGFLGIFLGPAVIAILVAFVRIYREQYAIGPESAPKAESGK
jgi:predicted PurR-regulated permease PerM